ncbi:MAG TPA: hypothetical protein PK781_04875 [Terrimesophilobacter sp.]|nr:hypothetical protein [Terrimesophilobacter sp.]HRP99779.1 hypothetical protein [Terrimesophilobacter sp.]
MSLVNDPQIWTLLGVFAAIMLGGMTLMTTLLMRTMNATIGGAIDGVNGRIDGVHARIDGLASEMRAGFAAVDAKFEAVNLRIDGVESTMNAKFETVNVKLEHLDRDVTAISKKVFGIPSD